LCDQGSSRFFLRLKLEPARCRIALETARRVPDYRQRESEGSIGIREAQPAYYWFDLDRMGHGRKRKRNPKQVIAIVLGTILAILAILLARG